MKCCEGWVVGMLAGRETRYRSGLALTAGVLVLVGGYFIFEALVYPALAKTIPFFGVTDYKAALAEIFPNLAQGILSAAIAFGIGQVFHKSAPPE